MLAAIPLFIAVATGDCPAQTATLRDITVVRAGDIATATFLLEGSASVVVLDRVGLRRAQIRMKPLRAAPAALGSAQIRPGVAAIRARIERRDVLITDIDFVDSVSGLVVSERRSGRVVVRITLGRSERRAPSTARNQWSLSTIVIDAGHGGKDPGAIGLGGLREKDVTLAVAQELARLIRRGMPGMKVILTRNTDTFVELYRRGQIANENQGRFFISIHCNSMPTRPHPVSGFECYVLRPGRSSDAARVASAENGAIRYEADQRRYGEDPELEIVAAMAQSAFARYSEEAAHRLRQGLSGSTLIPDRGVHQAGFLVLVGAAMPAVLVELGYLTNAHDARVLRSPTGRKNLAAGLYRGIRAFERYYARTLE